MMTEKGGGEKKKKSDACTVLRCPIPHPHPLAVSQINFDCATFVGPACFSPSSRGLGIQSGIPVGLGEQKHSVELGARQDGTQDPLLCGPLADESQDWDPSVPSS